MEKSYMEQWKEYKSEGGILSYQGFINRLNGAKPKKSHNKVYALHKAICGKYAAKRNVITSRIMNGGNTIDIVMLPKMDTGNGWKELFRKMSKEDKEEFKYIKERFALLVEKGLKSPLLGDVENMMVEEYIRNIEDLYSKIL